MEKNRDYKGQTAFLRRLARELAQAAAEEENQQKKKLWADHNELKTGIRPLLWVCPDDDGGWLELVPEQELFCTDTDLQNLERKLKKYLYQNRYLKDDFVLEPAVYMEIPGTYTGYLYGHQNQTEAWGVPMVKKQVGSNAYHLDCFLKTEEDYEKLLQHQVDFIVDEAEWKRLREKYEEVLDGIIEVQFQLPYSVLVQSLLIELVHLRGLQELMYDLYDDPQLLGRVLHHMAVSKAELLKKLEREQRLFDNRINLYTGSGGLGYTNAGLKKPEEVKLSDMWGFADAQEFSGVSNEMFEEFAIQNQKIGLNLFGMGCYGCCEPLDKKYDAIFKHIINIRRISVSPWSDIPTAMEQIGTKAIFSWKPDPAKICMGFDSDGVYRWLKETADATRDCVVEIILKDIQTCGGSNRNLVEFIRLAKKAFELE